ncbi:MAG: hypothetical protein Q4Q03_01465 [Bowdeniella nasicola]|nr:hypothetical protein [Bowdeniella nasicola]
MSRLAYARSVLAAAHDQVGVRTGQAPNPLPPALQRLIPLQYTRGKVLHISCLTILWQTVVALMGTQQWCIALGMHDIGWLAAQQLGIDFSRVIVVEKPASPATLSASIDGARVVITAGTTHLSGGDQRALAARLRQAGGSLVSLDPWPGAYQVHATTEQATGCGDGDGYLRERILHAHATAGRTRLCAHSAGVRLPTSSTSRGSHLRVVSAGQS